MKVTRKSIKKVPYLITDEVYEGEEIGINLDNLNNAKTKIALNIPSIPISNKKVRYYNLTNNIEIATTVKNDDKKIKVVADITYPDGRKETKESIIKDAVFAQEMIDVCIHQQKTIKHLPSYKSEVDSIVESIKQAALEENTLVKAPVLNHKIYVYDNNETLLGTANRLLESKTGHYILAEYIGKPAKESTSGNNIMFDICINKDLVLRVSNATVVDSTCMSIGYWDIDMSNAMIRRIKDKYDSIEYKVEKIKVPDQNVSMDISQYSKKFYEDNLDVHVLDFYMANKTSTHNKININKYLL